MPEQEERKPVTAYVVKHFENGDIEVEDAHLDGTTELSTDEIFRNIEQTAKAIELKHYENAAYMGIARFYDDMARRAAAEAQAAAAAAPAEDEAK
jgi:hypothetical protein